MLTVWLLIWWSSLAISSSAPILFVSGKQPVHYANVCHNHNWSLLATTMYHSFICLNVS
jgi:hypothetical protein